MSNQLVFQTPRAPALPGNDKPQLEDVDSGWHTVTCTTDTDEVITAVSFTMDADTAYWVEAVAIGRATDDSGETYVIKLRGLFENDGGTCTLVGNDNGTAIESFTTAPAATLVVDDTNDRATIGLDSNAAEVIAWKVVFRVIKV